MLSSYLVRTCDVIRILKCCIARLDDLIKFYKIDDQKFDMDLYRTSMRT